MAISSKTRLIRYKIACEALREDIKLAIQDRDFIDGGSILSYAIDFSEIHAYVLPSKIIRDFILFPDAFNEDEKDDAIALQQLILRYIFFELPKEQKLILLSPYVLEFRTFIRALKNNMLDDFVRNAVLIFNDLDELADKKQNRTLLSICKKIEANRIISDDENKILADFVQKYGHIQSILEEGTSEHDPFYRVKQLNVGSVFGLASDLINFESNLGTATYDRWKAELGKIRAQEKKSSVELDAAAVNIIYEANRKLDEATRLILVTRSESMHALYRKEYDEYWKDSVKYYLLRHPRTFSLSLAISQKTGRDLQDLKDLRATIDLFLLAYESWEKDTSQIDNNLLELLNKIKEGWKQIQKTALPISVSPLPVKSTNILDGAKTARIILGYARSSKKVYEKLAERVDDLFYNLDRAHELLGLDLSISPQINYEEYSDKWKLPTSPLLYPYKLIFETRFAKELIDKLPLELEHNISRHITSIFTSSGFERRKSDKGKIAYENILLMAYLLGLLGKWEIAEAYCARAVQLGVPNHIPTHEALYFQAVCKRESRKSENWLSEALKLIDQAIDNLESYNIKDNIEAKFWLEQGIAILVAHQHKAIDVNSTTVDEGLDIIEQWEDKLVDNLPLHLLVLRLELIYFVRYQRNRRLKRLKDKFKLIETALLEVGIDSIYWPSYIVDALYWGKWVLFSGDDSDTTWKEMSIIQLEQAAKREPDRKIRDEIMNHIEDMRTEKLYQS